MCGIFGIIQRSPGKGIDPATQRSALAALGHRGPDAQRVANINEEVILGHTRLSILDLDIRSNQPMTAAGRWWIVYNGEVFNYLELRRELEARGVSFRTSGDTEVVLQAYATWGEDCVSRFNGMWAFAIWDTETRTLFCSRDRYGEKPFNYALIDGNFFFASEIKAILAVRPDFAEPDYNVISNFCRTSVGGQNAQTWFKKIARLQPGHNLILRDGNLSTKRYWQYPKTVNENISFEDACDRYRTLFLDAVSLRMRSDVPLGLTLSSGLDSTSIAYAMRAIDQAPHHCFTSGFDTHLGANSSIYNSKNINADEATKAEQIAKELGLNWHLVTTNYSDFVQSLSRVIWHLESGHSSPAIIPLFQLLEQARKYVRVILEGQGADELLGGYVGNLLWPATFELVKERKILSAFRNIREFSRTYKLGYAAKLALRDLSNDLNVLSRVQQYMSGIDAVFGPALKPYRRLKDFPELPGEGGQSALSQALLSQHSGGLVNLLHYGDGISMANSVESRLPFTDHRLVEFVWTLPSEYKLKSGVGKRLHREAMRGIVPNSILDERTKFGFVTPIQSQFVERGNNNENGLEVILSRRCLERGIFEEQGVRRLISMHRSGRHDHSMLLFRMLGVELWFRQFVDQHEPSRVLQF